MNVTVVLFVLPTYTCHIPFFQRCGFKLNVITTIKETQTLFNQHNNVLVTIGESFTEYAIPNIKMFLLKWLHFHPARLTDTGDIERRVLECFVVNMSKQIDMRPQVSAFTTSYKSAHKIYRPYLSLLNQTCPDWEWVVVDDSPGDENFRLLSSLNDPRVRCYKRSFNSTYIGNVKNEAHSLCRGKYLIELDHDDELMPECCADTVKGFESDQQVGFIYMNFAELYEDWREFKYSDAWGWGHGSYYRQFVPCRIVNGIKVLDGERVLVGNTPEMTDQDGNTPEMTGLVTGGEMTGHWQNVAITAPINNITVTDLACMPNHPRIWRKTVLDEIGGYCESCSDADDYEVLMRTFFATKMLRISKLAYLQYRNDGGNQSISRIRSIRTIQDAVSRHYRPKIDEWFANRPKTWISGAVWNEKEYVDTHVNEIANFDSQEEIMIRSLDSLIDLPIERRKDVIFLTNKEPGDVPKDIKYYYFPDYTDEQLELFFHRCYKTAKEWRVIK